MLLSTTRFSYRPNRIMQVKLEKVRGETEFPSYTVALPLVVGRSRTAGLPLKHPLVSRRHCELFEEGGQVMVRDLGSLNGTYVNKRKVEADTPLPPGALLTLGVTTFRAVYESPDGAESAAATPHDSLALTLPAASATAVAAVTEPVEEFTVGEAAAQADDGLGLDWLEQPSAETQYAPPSASPEASAAADELALPVEEEPAPQAESEAELGFSLVDEPALPEPAAEEELDFSPIDQPAADDEDLPISLVDEAAPQAEEPVELAPIVETDSPELALPDTSAEYLPLPEPDGAEGPAERPVADDLDDFFRSLG